MSSSTNHVAPSLLSGLYYPFSRCVDANALKQLLLVFDCITFLDPVEDAAWRAQLLASGWRTLRDDTVVVVARRGAQLSLEVVDGTAYLTASEPGGDPCEAGRPQPGDGARMDDPEVEVASPPCS